jgi:hypothetical protein
MGIDSKDVFNEAYYAAIEEGRSEDEAAAIAHEKMVDHEAALVDAAYERWKYRDL